LTTDQKFLAGTLAGIDRSLPSLPPGRKPDPGPRIGSSPLHAQPAGNIYTYGRSGFSGGAKDATLFCSRSNISANE
jgi:hypothetical protein